MKPSRPQGRIRDIRLYGDAVLRSKALKVEKIDDELLQLVADLVETMLAKDGLGLAANQIGEMRAIVVLNPRAIGIEQDIQILINPEIAESSGEIEREEACLSLPGISEVLVRPARTRVTAVDCAGKVIELRAEGTLARALHHEIDHLNGLLFVDHLPPLRRKLLAGRLQEIEKEGKTRGQKKP